MLPRLVTSRAASCNHGGPIGTGSFADLRSARMTLVSNRRVCVSPRQGQQSQTRREELLSPKGKSANCSTYFVRVNVFGCVPGRYLQSSKRRGDQFS